MITIRSYLKTDWRMVLGWWKSAGEVAPTETMMPPESSFIAEVDGKPALAVALYLTNIPDIAWAENFIGNPEIPRDCRRIASRLLLTHVEEFAKKRGYLRLLCMSEKPELKSYYELLGFTRTLDGIASFVKEISQCPQL